MEHQDGWFTFTAEEACTHSAQALLELMGNITGEYDARHYVIRAVESDRVTLYYSESTERNSHFARLDDWYEYVKKNLVIRPPQGSEDHGQVVAYPGYDSPDA